jgi:capsular polysaccharide biosynthesis protein
LALTLGKVSSHARMMGGLDLIVDLLPSSRLPQGADDHADVFEALFPFLRQHGAYILDRRPDGAASTMESLSRLFTLLAAVEDRKAIAGLHGKRAEVARSIGTVTMTRDLVLVTKRHRQLVKLRDEHVNRILPAREPSLQVTELEKRRGGEFASKASVVSHGVDLLGDSAPSVITYPDLHLRHYEGRVALAGQTLMFTGDTILPDSFRWHLLDDPSHPRLKAAPRNFARVPSTYIPRRELDGDFYQLDSTYPHHYGHVMTEVISRLWGWDRAKREIPGLKAIFHLKPQSRREPALEKALFTAYGIAESDIAWVNEPVWLSSVVSATPMWHNAVPHHVHPDMIDTWHRLGRGLVGGADLPASPERIFVSRGGGLKHRTCRNAEAVEKLFVDRGFQVVYPEKLSLAEQVATFRDARVVAGFGGSAMFNLMYAEKLETVILLNSEAYTARNEHLFTSLIGAEVHYFWSRPDIEHPEGGWTQDAFFADWEFDFARNGDALETVLAQLA